jgi:hypothetical protein
MAKQARASHASMRSMLTHKQETQLAIESVSMERIKKLGEEIKAKIAQLSKEGHRVEAK